MKSQMRSVILLLLSILFSSSICAQVVYEDERYVPETNPLVLKKLAKWQTLKFGLLMHWGTYSQWGIPESWTICPEENSWCNRTKGSNPNDYFTYKREYEGLKNTFNPVKFNPEKWAKAAKDAGMKYVVFTTKHHDGFCMFDTKYTDYKVTAKDCPFSSNPRSNIAKEIFDAFRTQGLWAGAYFSKPDWHSPYYWDPKYPPRDRNVNYGPSEDPERWQKFVDFTQNQMLELLTDYGKIDILWLDGGQVAKTSKEEIAAFYKRASSKSEDGYIKGRIINQDIKMDEFVKKARKIRPDLIVVDRAVHGINQNYLTPENRVPDKTLPYPWESCVTSGGGFSYTYDAKYMSGHDGIQLLVDIVSKGGNLLLNIAPSGQGEWQPGAYRLLQDYASWMKDNGEAIYGTKTLVPYKENNICMTQNDRGDHFFYYLCKEGEKKMPKEVVIESNQPPRGSHITMLGSKSHLSWKKRGDGFVIRIPRSLRNNPPCDFVWTFKVSAK